MAGSRGGVLGVTGPPPPPHTHTQHSYIYKCRSIEISFRLGGLRRVKIANSFFWGRGVSEEVKTLGEAPPLLNYRLPRTVKNYDIYAVSYSVTPPPRVSGSAPAPLFWIFPCGKMWICSGHNIRTSYLIECLIR